METAVLSLDALGGERGALSFMVFQGKFMAPVFVRFLKRSLKDNPGRIYLLSKGIARTDRARSAASWSSTGSGSSGCRAAGRSSTAMICPTRTSKPTTLGRAARPTVASSWAVCAVISTGGRSNPPVIRRFFQEQPVRYAA